jgi:hypothetical protein
MSARRRAKVRRFPRNINRLQRFFAGAGDRRRHGIPNSCIDCRGRSAADFGQPAGINL